MPLQGSVIYQIVNSQGGLNGAHYRFGSDHITYLPTGGVYLASVINVDSVAQSAQGTGVLVLVNQENAGIIATSIGAPATVLTDLWAAPAGQRTWRPSGAVGGSTPYVDANHLDDAEAQSLLTSTANAINSHTTAAKAEVLAAVAVASNGSAPTQFTIALSGTATA